MEEQTVPCIWCGQQTRFLGTKKCDGCWELYRRIEWDTEIAERMIQFIRGRDNE